MYAPTYFGTPAPDSRWCLPIAAAKVRAEGPTPFPRLQAGASQEIPTAAFVETLRMAAEYLAIGEGDLLDRLLGACGCLLSMGMPASHIPATVQDEMDTLRQRMFDASLSGQLTGPDEVDGSAGPHARAANVRYLQDLVPDDQKALANDILRWLSEADRADAHWLAFNEGAGALAPTWHFET